MPPSPTRSVVEKPLSCARHFDFLVSRERCRVRLHKERQRRVLRKFILAAQLHHRSRPIRMNTLIHQLHARPRRLHGCVQIQHSSVLQRDLGRNLVVLVKRSGVRTREQQRVFTAAVRERPAGEKTALLTVMVATSSSRVPFNTP